MKYYDYCPSYSFGENATFKGNKVKGTVISSYVNRTKPGSWMSWADLSLVCTLKVIGKY